MDLFLIAHVAGRAVAIDTTEIDSVVDLAPVVAVPRAPGSVRGLTALRSRVVTVIDTCLALGLDPMPADARRAIITRVDGHHYAMLVDTLDDVAPFELRPLASGIALDGNWRAAARGLVERDGEPILVVDLAALVPASALLS